MQSTVNYTYDGTWGDLLTGYNGKTITSDTIGNMLSDGTWNYSWEHGRELLSMSNGSTTWTNTYNADGLRTKRTDGSTTYSYIYNGSKLSQMTVGSNTLTQLQTIDRSSISSWAVGGVDYCYTNGLIAEKYMYALAPKNMVKRSEIADVLYRFCLLQEADGH